MENAIIAYDISGILILLISTIYFVRANPSGTVRFSLNLHLMVIGLIIGVLDVSRVELAQGAYYGTIGWHTINSVYLIFSLLVVPLYLIYIISITDTWHLVNRNKNSKLVMIIPAAIGCMLILFGIFSPVILTVSEDGKIHYQWGFVVVCVLMILYLGMCLFYVKKLQKFLPSSYCFVLDVPVIIMTVAYIIQIFASNHHLIVFAISVNCMYLILISRKAEDTLDVVTGMHSYRAFAQNMNMKMRTGKEMQLIILNILNYEHTMRLASYDYTLELMRRIADEIQEILRTYHAPNTCYYNGDGKFAIELSPKHYPIVDEISGKIIKVMNQNMQFEVSDLEIMINACIVKCPQDVSDAESLFVLISDLDIYPYTGKVLSASEITDTKDFVMKKEMAMILDRAINNHYFSVFYQPIYDVKEKRFASAEALIRLRDPKYGYISPGVFIPLAEKSGAIHEIGSFVIDEVCKFIGSEGFEELGVDYIEINLSVMQCLRTDLADEIISKAKKYGINPAKLNLEITETASAYSQEKLRGNIMALSKAGFTFSLDDFGTGYSNLMRITSLPLSIIKLDRTFVLLIEEKESFISIIRNMILMLKDMGFKILVEGIENKEMVNTFIDLGVEEIQGFYFSRPLTKTDYIRFLKEHLKNNNLLEI